MTPDRPVITTHNVTAWRPYAEPLRATLVRTTAIALVVGVIVAACWGRPSRWPAAALVAFWPSFGGHWVELGFLNGLRPRLSRARTIQVGVRLAAWFVGGVVLALGMRLTAGAMIGPAAARWPTWWLGGVGFIGIELVVHLALQLRGRPSFYNRRG